MSESKHTAEPWVESCGRIWDGNSVNRLIATVAELSFDAAGRKDVPGHILGKETDANAARIVACVNACAGIPDPEAIGELVEAAEIAIAGHPGSGYTDRLRAALAKLGRGEK